MNKVSASMFFFLTPDTWSASGGTPETLRFGAWDLGFRNADCEMQNEVALCDSPGMMT